jgi:iron complex transport system substrate-binding protein
MRMGNPSDVRRHIVARSRRRKGAAAFTFACGLLFFCNSAAAAPLRVVSTNLCADEYVFRLVPRAHIAALSFEAGDRHPVVSTIADKVGGIPQIHPGTETVLNFRPDLVVMQSGTLARLHVGLKALGVAVLDLPYDNSLADIRKTARMLGTVLGAEARAAAMVAQMERTLAAARRDAPRPSVRTLIYEPNGYAAAGGVTQALMALAGLSDAAPGFALTRSGRIPVEEVIAAAPELMILSGERERPTAEADLVLHHPALALLAERTYSAWEPLVPLLCAGPWSAQAAVTFAGLGRKARLLAKRQAHN